MRVIQHVAFTLPSSTCCHIPILHSLSCLYLLPGAQRHHLEDSSSCWGHGQLRRAGAGHRGEGHHLAHTYCTFILTFASVACVASSTTTIFGVGDRGDHLCESARCSWHLAAATLARHACGVSQQPVAEAAVAEAASCRSSSQLQKQRVRRFDVVSCTAQETRRISKSTNQNQKKSKTIFIFLKKKTKSKTMKKQMKHK